jgi:integrase
MAGWIRRADSGRYQARYRVPGGRTRSRTFERRRDADRWLRHEVARLDRGDWIDPDAGTVTIAEWSDRWMATRLHIRDSTRERDETYLRSLVLPHFGTQRLRDITRHDIQDWIAELSEEGYAAATIQLAYGLVSMAFNAAVDDALIQRTPCSGVNLPKRSQVEKRFLSVEELHDLADTIDSRHRTLVLTAGYTGARFGELAALQPRDLDLGRRRVTITRSLAEVRGAIAETEPKTAASKRSITLPRAVVDDLAAHLDHHATGRTDRVFTAPQGGPLRRRSFRQRFWLPAVDASVGQPMRFHDLRHTHAALLIAANTHPKLLQSRLGHSSIKTTLDIYGHLYEPLDEIAADRLEQLIADAIAHRTRADRGLEM